MIHGVTVPQVEGDGEVAAHVGEGPQLVIDKADQGGAGAGAIGEQVRGQHRDHHEAVPGQERRGAEGDTAEPHSAAPEPAPLGVDAHQD
jgi:hypothetical protein